MYEGVHLAWSQKVALYLLSCLKVTYYGLESLSRDPCICQFQDCTRLKQGCLWVIQVQMFWLFDPHFWYQRRKSLYYRYICTVEVLKLSCYLAFGVSPQSSDSYSCKFSVLLKSHVLWTLAHIALMQICYHTKTIFVRLCRLQNPGLTVDFYLHGSICCTSYTRDAWRYLKVVYTSESYLRDSLRMSFRLT